jgi:long-chain acyl-CoA synthetase
LRVAHINQSVPEVFRWRCSQTPDLPWLIWKEGGARRELTYAQGYAEVERAARALIELGIKNQDRVGVYSKNRPEWVLGDLGAIHAGAIPVPIYATLSQAQVEHIVAHSEMRLCFVENDAMLARLLEAKARVPKLERIVLLGGPAPADPPLPVMTWDGFLSLAEKQKGSDPGAFEKRWADLRRDDLLTIVYTSGTTGTPKGVMLTQGNILSQMETLQRVVPIQVDDLTISYLPLAHILERTAGEFLPIMNGNRIAFAESMEKLPDNIREFKPNYMLAVPRVLEKVHERIVGQVEEKGGASKRIFWWAVEAGKRWQQVRYDKRVPAGARLKHRIAAKLVYGKVREGLGGNMRFIVSGAAPLDVEIAEFFRAIDLPVLEGYGLTESSPVIAVNTLDQVMPGTVGKMIPGIQVEIWEKTLQGAPPDVEGEIVTKGPHVMKGYYKDDKATREAVDREGWLHTGDIGKRDVRGYISITDRKKDLIVNSYGKNIAPAPIEASIATHTMVGAVMVVGDKHKYLVALIQPAFEALERWAKGAGVAFGSRAELVAHPKVVQLYRGILDASGEQFSQPEQVRRFALLDHELTVEDESLTPTLKVRRANVAKRYAALIDPLYADEHEYKPEAWDGGARPGEGKGQKAPRSPA